MNTQTRLCCVNVQLIMYVKPKHTEVCNVYLHSASLYTVANRKFNWRRYCYCVEMVDHCPLFDETLRHIELCNSVINHIQRNPTKFKQCGSNPVLDWVLKNNQHGSVYLCNTVNKYQRAVLDQKKLEIFCIFWPWSWGRNLSGSKKAAVWGYSGRAWHMGHTSNNRTPPPPYIDDIPSIQYIASIHTRTLLYCLYFTTYTVVLVRELLYIRR